MSDELQIPELVLASISPRRALLLRQVGIPFIVIPPQARESMPVNGNFSETVIRNAEDKAVSVVSASAGRAIVGADTIVDLDGRALGKPQDREEARLMLQQLSGRTHRVHTGLVLLDPASNLIYREHALTSVTFRELLPTEIEAYLDSGEPFDKAGAYGIQERGALFISNIEGCFFNVMGLPLAKFWEMLLRWRRQTGNL